MFPPCMSHRTTFSTAAAMDRDVPPIWPAQYDVRALLAAAKTLNDGRLPGERMLTRLLRGTYYEDILP